MCRKKWYILTCLMLASLSGHAVIDIPDSLLTVRKAYSYNIKSLDTSLTIIQTMREQQLAPTWLLDLTEGDMYCNTRRFRKAIPYYERALADPVMRDSSQVEMKLLKRLMDANDVLNNDGSLAFYIHRLMKLAEQQKNAPYQAMAKFMYGKRQHFHGKKDEGYRLCFEAVEQMKHSDYYRRQNELRAFYAELLNMYVRDKRIDDALRMSKLQEEAAREASRISVELVDQRAMRRVYALRASVLALAGRQASADSAYAAWVATDGGNAVDDREILNYLICSHRYREALGVVHRFADFLTEIGDTVSFTMLRTFNKEAMLHSALGEYGQVTEHYDAIDNIVDSILIRRSQMQMQEAGVLIQEREEMHRRNLWLVAGGLLLVALLAMWLINLYYTNVLRRRNKHFLKLLNKLEAYRKALITDSSEKEPSDTPASQGELESPITMSEDERLYVEMDKAVTSGQLYRNPDFGREDLLRICGVDKNRFGRMIARYSDASNTSVYINSKRVAYGAQLLIEHPNYTIAAVAKECGMANTVTFNRTFKDVFGMTPSEYRAQHTQLLGGVKRTDQTP